MRCVLIHAIAHGNCLLFKELLWMFLFKHSKSTLHTKKFVQDPASTSSQQVVVPLAYIRRDITPSAYAWPCRVRSQCLPDCIFSSKLASVPVGWLGGRCTGPLGRPTESPLHP